MHRVMAAVALAIMSTGCVSLSKGAPDQQRYICTTHGNLTECSEQPQAGSIEREARRSPPHQRGLRSD